MQDYTGHLGDGPHNVETLIAEDDFQREYNDSFHDRHVRLYQWRKDNLPLTQQDIDAGGELPLG